jgi:putative endonuclease
MKEWMVYILRCNDGTLYTGITTNIARRLKEHNEGVGSKYTRGRRPVVLEYLEGGYDKSEATIMELFIKSRSRAIKERIIKSSQ